MNTFTGIPPAAIEFYRLLNANNNRQWWLAHKEMYDGDVRLPLQNLLSALETRFGPGVTFRPYRDMRFNRGQNPYKEVQTAFASHYERVGFYLQIGASGLRLSGGCRSFPPAQLSRYRAAVDAELSGAALERIICHLIEQGFTVEGRSLMSTPRGYSRSHPRAALLRHKTLSASLDLGAPDWLGSEEAVPEIAGRWELVRPLVDWLLRYAPP